MFTTMPFYRKSDTVFDAFDKFFAAASASTVATFPTDVRQGEDYYQLEAELPGFRKEDISLDVKDGILTISAENKSEAQERTRENGYICRERRFASFSRSFDISGIDETAITASLENGILKLMLPKTQPIAPQVHRITVN